MLSSCTLIYQSFCWLHFTFILSFTQPFVYKGPISVLKRDFFLGKEGHGQKKFLVALHPHLLFSFTRRGARVLVSFYC